MENINVDDYEMPIQPVNGPKAHYDDVEAVFNKLAVEAMVVRAKKKTISQYVNKMYQDCKQYLDDYNIDLHQFAAYTTNYNPSKSGIGQKAQLIILLQKDKDIEELPQKGKNSIRFNNKDGKNIICKCSKEATNITNIKAFDAIKDDKDKCKLFVLKTIDIGKYSDSIGGGGQDNVKEEIKAIVDLVCQNNEQFIFDEKPVEIIIVIDGRSSQAIIDEQTTKIKNIPYIKIGTSAQIINGVI